MIIKKRSKKRSKNTHEGVIRAMANHAGQGKQLGALVLVAEWRLSRVESIVCTWPLLGFLERLSRLGTSHTPSDRAREVIMFCDNF